MEVRSSVTAISWIPSEAVTGLTDAAFKAGFTHYDPAPPDAIGPDVPATIEDLRIADRFRFANHLVAVAEFDDDGRCVRPSYTGAGAIGATTVRFGKRFTVAAVQPARSPGRARDRRRLGALQPDRGWAHRAARATSRSPAAVRAATSRRSAWSTLELVLHADGRAEGRLVGASPFPRHWVYDGDRHAGGQEWHDRLQELGRQRLRLPHAVGRRGLAGAGHRGRDRPRTAAVRRDHAGRGQAGDPPPAGWALPDHRRATTVTSCTSLLDGVAGGRGRRPELGRGRAGAVLGERAVLEGGTRTSTLRAVTPVPASPSPRRTRSTGPSWRRCRPTTVVRSRRPPTDARAPLRRPRLDARRPAPPSSASAATRRASPSPTTPRPRRGSCSTAAPGCATWPRLLDDEPFRGSVVLTHLHWDHTQGLPFFTAGDRPDARVDVRLPSTGDDAGHTLDPMMGPPFFPITAGRAARVLALHGARGEGVSTSRASTPWPAGCRIRAGTTYGLRLSDGRIVDGLRARPRASRPRSRSGRLGPVPRGRAGAGRRRRPVAPRRPVPRRASWRPRPASATPRWSTPSRWREHAGVGRLLLFHHDPWRTDDEVDAIVTACAGRRRTWPPPSRATRSHLTDARRRSGPSPRGTSSSVRSSG